ncbi:hypothetical protein CXF85_02775 [Colwellia sp. 75C3]|uniref:hypothetical protein n=1 Tax=Colwellia sp. 75C3 TaxID=888425 RepID=UPI000C34917D|nr:hypothetical protein [Colwellia sp. 75C3]PKG85732.1 hypothetical protein CXF85_02775 [Colwellia sp. 75C3]
MDIEDNIQGDILEQNNTILNQFYDGLKENIDEYNKVNINNPQFPSFYLPPICKIYALVDFITNQKQLIDLLEQTYERPLEISRTSKYGFFSKGVGLSTVNKITNWLKIIPFPFEQLANKRIFAKVIKTLNAGSNAGGWLCAISSSDIGFKHTSHNDEDVFSSLFRFIEQRCNTDVDFLLNIRADIKAGGVNRDNIAEVWIAQQSLWKNTRCIPKSAIDRSAEFILLHQQNVSLSRQQVLCFIESLLYFELDFFMEAITSYEVGYRIYFATEKEEIESLNERGMITNAIHAFATQKNIKTCFAGLLKEFKDISSDLVGDETSYRKLATFIEIHEDELSESGESLEDKQYNQLKDWRNGKNLPSNKKLATFLKNLDEYANIDSGVFSFYMCRITMGVDKLVNEILADTKNESCNQADIKVAIKKVLANIPYYYLSNLVKELDNKHPKKRASNI